MLLILIKAGGLISSFITSSRPLIYLLLYSFPAMIAPFPDTSAPPPLPRDYPYRNSTDEVPSKILQAPIHGAGGREGDGKEAASLQCTGKWKIKSITAKG